MYRSEWSVAYVSDSDGETGRQECLRRFEDFFRDENRFEDWRVTQWSPVDPCWGYFLELLAPVMKGEHRTRHAALVHAREISGFVLQEGSRDDLRLRRRFG